MEATTRCSCERQAEGSADQADDAGANHRGSEEIKPARAGRRRRTGRPRVRP